MQNEDIERIRDALHSIPASDRDMWLRMGMGIKAELGEGGFDMWDQWSQQDESYDPAAARSVWKSIKANGKGSRPKCGGNLLKHDLRRCRA